MNITDKLYNLTDWICRFFMLGMVLIVTIVVIGRFVFNTTPGWGEELAITCMIWFGLLSSAMAEKRNDHIRIKVLDTLYPKILVKIFRIAHYLAKLSFALILIVVGFKLTVFNIPVVMSGLPLSEAFIYAAGPVTGLIMLYFLLARFNKEIFSS